VTDKEILKLAKQRIEKYGWIQGNFGDEQCGFCSAGAFLDIYANGEKVETYWARLKLQRLVGALLSWNDAPGRTKEEVLAAFDKAIKAEP
jgi:hypothetical protein